MDIPGVTQEDRAAVLEHVEQQRRRDRNRRRRNRRRVLPIGTISSGTLRPEDVIPELLYSARQLKMTAAGRADVREVARQWGRIENGEGIETGEDLDAGDLCQELMNVLEQYTPDYCYLGATEGDGAELGVWPVRELLECGEVGGYDGCVASSREDARPEHTHALEVNDHGNATLWRRVRAGRLKNGGPRFRWLECWSIV